MRRRELTERYEELRAQAMGKSGMAAPLGLALFLRRGMPAWLEAWSGCMPPETPGLEPYSVAKPLPDPPCNEVAVVLAGMILFSCREVRA